MRRALILLAGAATTLALSGCHVHFKGEPTIAQQDVIGKVRVAFELCISERASSHPPGCGTHSSSNQNGQILLAFRVPAGTGLPPGFATVSGRPLRFTRSPSYEHEVERTDPAPAGQVWAGYISELGSYQAPPSGSPPESFGFAVQFGLPAGAGGGPFAEPFQLRMRVGARGSGDPERTVSCDGLSTDCDFDNRPTGDSPYSLRVRDVVISGAGSAATGLGRRVRLSFRADYAGPAPPFPLALVADSDLPGATERAAPAAFAPPGTGVSPLAVEVTTPRSARSGVYRVSLSVVAPGGTSRTGHAVFALDGDRPVLRSLRVSPRALVVASAASAARRSRMRISYRLSEPGRVTIKVRRRVRGVRKGRRCVRGTPTRGRSACIRRVKLRGSLRGPAETGLNTLRFSGRLRGRARPPGSYELLARPVDRAGNRGRAVIARFRVYPADVPPPVIRPCASSEAHAAC